MGGAVARESMVATFEAGLANGPGPATLSGVQVTVTDGKGVARLAPMYFVSQGQPLYLIPAE